MIALYFSYFLLCLGLLSLLVKSDRKYLLGLISSGLSAISFLFFSLSGGDFSASWMPSFHIILTSKVVGFDVVSQFFILLVFPYLHFFLYRAPSKKIIYLFVLLVTQILYQLSTVAGNLFIDFQCLLGVTILVFVFIQSQFPNASHAISGWLKRSFLALALLFASILLVYFFRENAGEEFSYAINTWRSEGSFAVQVYYQGYYFHVQNLSYFLFFAGTVLLMGLLDFRGYRSRLAASLGGTAGALFCFLFYILPTLFYVRTSLGIYSESLIKFRTELLCMHFILFVLAVIRVGLQKDMRSKLIHMHGIFCSLVFLGLPTLNAGVILGSLCLLFSAMYLLVVTLISMDVTPEKATSTGPAQKSLFVMAFCHSLFFPMSIAFFGIIQVFIGISNQSQWLAPVIGFIFFFPWYSLVHYFSRTKSFFRHDVPGAVVSIVLLMPPLVLGVLPRELFGPIIKSCESFLKGVL